MAERALPDLVSRVFVDTSPLNAAVAGISGAMGAMTGRVKDASGEMDGHFNAIKGGMLAVGGVMAGTAIAVGAEALKMASEFDNATRQLAGSAQIPVESAQAISKSFLDTGDTTTFSAQQMISALGPVSGQLELLTGHALTTADAHMTMTAAAELAEASHTDLGNATKVLSGVMLAYHIPLSQAAETTDLLFNTSRTLNVPLDDLQNVLARLHARLGPLSPSLGDTSTLMIDLAENGITGSRAMNQVNTAMTTLLGGTPEVSAEIQKLGIHIFDSQGHFVGLRSVIDQVHTAEAGMTEQQKLATDSILFGGTSAKGMFDVIQGGVGTWDKASAAANQAGTAHKAAGDAMGGVEGQQKVLSAQMSNLGVVIGTALLPVLISVLGAISPVVTAMVHWASTHQQLATVILVAVGAMGVLLIAIVALSVVVGAFEAIASPLLFIIIAIIAAVAILAVGIYLLVTHWNQVVQVATNVWHWIVQLVSAHQGLAIAVAILLGPIGWLIAAIVLVVTHWRQIWAVMQEFAGWIVGFFTGIWHGLVGAITGAFSGIYNTIAGWLSAIYNFIVGHLVQAYNMFQFYWTFIWNVVSGIVAGIHNTIAGWLSAIYNFVVGHLVQAYNMFQFYWTFIWNVVSGIVAGIHNTIAGWLSAIYNFIVGHLVQAYNMFQFYWTFIWNVVSGIVAGIHNTIAGWLSAIYNFIVGHLVQAWNAFQFYWTFIWNTISGIWNGIWGTISHWAETILNTIKKWVQDHWDTIYYWFTFIHTWIDQKWNGIWGTISYWAGRVRDTVGDVFNSLGTIVHKALEDLGYQVGKDVNWIIHRVNDFLDKVWATFHGFGIDLPIHDIPHLEGYPYAEGGIVDRPTHAIVGEAGHPETIIPWDPAKRDQALDLWQTTGLALGAVPLSGAREGKGAGPNLDNVPTSGHGGQCLAFLSQYFPQLRGIPAAKDAASLINSNTAKPGEVAINTSIAPYGHAALVINPPNMVLDSNWDEHENIMIHPLSDVKAAGFIDFGATLGTLAGGAAGGIFDVAQLINQLIDQILAGAGAGPQWLSGTLPAILKNMAGPQLIDWIKKNFAAQISKLTSSVAGAFSAIKGAFAGGVDQWISQGEQLAGVGDDWHAALKARIGVESGGDPNIDQSGLTGYAQAHGIMQMINSTFAAYALPGHTNIYNPVDNIAAAIKYIEKRYGGWQGMPSLSQGYDQGGVFPSGTLGYNTSGEDEYVFTKGQLRGLGGGPADDRVLEVLQRIEQKVVGNLQVNTYGTTLTPRDVAREIVQEVRAI